MSPLDEFLRGTFDELDRQRIEIDAIIQKVIQALLSLYDKEFGYPYEVWDADGEVRPQSLSVSTVAMISAALLTAGGASGGSILSGFVNWQPEDGALRAPEAQILSIAKDGLELLLQESESKGQQSHQIFNSRTFGDDDVLTICWLIDVYTSLISRLTGSNTKEPREALIKRVHLLFGKLAGTRNDLFSSDPNQIIASGMFKNKSEKSFTAKKWSHSFPLLRILQIKRSAGTLGAGLLGEPFQGLAPVDAPRWQNEFARRVHEQLSFHSIPDSRFDPAELVFALEGLALARPSFKSAVAKRAIDVLEAEQTRNPTLRPARPIVAEAAGKALFPVSVEIYNSLLRIEAIANNQFASKAIRTKIVALCRRYHDWLLPRLVDGGQSRPKLYGWHSEHINDPALVHPWETSQVLLFLLGYRTLLDQHLSAEAAYAQG